MYFFLDRLPICPFAWLSPPPFSGLRIGFYSRNLENLMVEFQSCPQIPMQDSQAARKPVLHPRRAALARRIHKEKHMINWSKRVSPLVQAQQTPSTLGAGKIFEESPVMLRGLPRAGSCTLCPVPTPAGMPQWSGDWEERAMPSLPLGLWGPTESLSASRVCQGRQMWGSHQSPVSSAMKQHLHYPPFSGLLSKVLV